MSVREYVGARYIPLFVGDWDSTKTYEPLSVVYYQGASYTSRQYVPTGVEITNTDYWALSADYNAQVEAYRNEVQAILPYDTTPTQDSTKGVTSGGVYSAVTEVSDVVDGIAPLDTTPTQSSTKGVTSGGVYEAISDLTDSVTAIKPYNSALGIQLYGTANYPAGYTVQSCCIHGSNLIITGVSQNDNTAVAYSVVDLDNNTQSYTTHTYSTGTHQNSIFWDDAKERFIVLADTSKVYEVTSDFTIVNTYTISDYSITAICAKDDTSYYALGLASSNTEIYLYTLDATTYAVTSTLLELPGGITQQPTLMSDGNVLIAYSNKAYIYSSKSNTIINSFILNEPYIEIEGFACYNGTWMMCANGFLQGGTSVYLAGIDGALGGYSQVNSNALTFNYNNDNTFYLSQAYYSGTLSTIHCLDMPYAQYINCVVHVYSDLSITRIPPKRVMFYASNVTVSIQPSTGGVLMVYAASTYNDCIVDMPSAQNAAHQLTIILDGYVTLTGTFSYCDIYKVSQNSNISFAQNLTSVGIKAASTLACLVLCSGAISPGNVTNSIFANSENVSNAIASVAFNRIFAEVSATADGDTYLVPIYSSRTHQLTFRGSANYGSAINILLTYGNNDLYLNDLTIDGSNGYLRSIYII